MSTGIAPAIRSDAENRALIKSDAIRIRSIIDGYQALQPRYVCAELASDWSQRPISEGGAIQLILPRPRAGLERRLSQLLLVDFAISALVAAHDREDHMQVELAPNDGVAVSFSAKDGHAETISFQDAVFK